MRFSSLFENAHVKAQEIQGIEDDNPAILYDPSIHGSLRRFEGGAEHGQLLEQFKDRLESLQGFLVGNDRSEGAERLEEYWERLRLGSRYPQFGRDVTAIYNEGMMALHRIEQLSRNEDIPLDDRVAKIDNISQDVLVCANGGLSNLQEAVGDLRLSSQSFKARAVRLALRKSDAFIQQYVEASFAPSRDVPGWANYEPYEVHLVNLFKSKSVPFLWGDLTDNTALDAERRFNVRQEHLDEFHRIHDENVNARSIVVDLANDCMREIGNEYKDLYGRSLNSNDMFQLTDIYNETFKPGLTPNYGEIKLDYLFSTAYLPRPLRTDSTEDRALLKDQAVLELRIANNLAAVGALDDHDPIRLTSASTSGEVLEDFNGALLVNRPDINEVRKVEVEDLEWIGKQWRPPDGKTFLDTARQIVEGQAGGELNQRLRDGDVNGVRRFLRAIQGLNDNLRAELLKTASEERGVSAFFDAMGNGHAEVVLVYAAAIRTLPPEMQGRLLKASRSTTNPEPAEIESGMAVAMSSGRADVVRAYVEAIRGLNPDEQARFIDPVGPNGQSCLTTALERNDAEVIRAYGEALHQVRPEVRDRYLEAHPGLHYALANGHAEAIRAYAELLQSCSRERQAELLQGGKDDNGTGGLSLAIERGHVDAIRAYTGAVRRLGDAGEHLLEAGADGLRAALDKGSAEPVRAYAAAIDMLPLATQVRIMERASTGLKGAIRRGDAQTVEAYTTAIAGFTPEVRRRLLGCGDPGMAAALASTLARNDRTTLDIYLQAASHVDREFCARFADMEQILAEKSLKEAFLTNDAQHVRTYACFVEGLGVGAEAHAELLTLSGSLKHAVKNGHLGVINDYASAIGQLNPEHQDRVFSTAFGSRTTPQEFIGTVLSEGDAAKVKAYIAALEPLHSEVRGKYLTPADRRSGRTALAESLDKGYASAVGSYVAAVASLSHPEAGELQIKLLEARGREDDSSSDDDNSFRRRRHSMDEGVGVGRAVTKRSPATVGAYLAALQPLGEEVRAKLAYSHQANGEPAICIALDRGDSQMVKAFADNTAYLDNKDSLALLGGENRSGASRLAVALDARNSNQIKSCIKAFENLDSDVTAELLVAKGADGRGFLQRAFDRGAKDDVALYVESMLDRAADELQHILAARDTTGQAGLTRAIEGGHVSAVIGFRDAIRALSPNLQAELLAAKNSAGQPALTQILCSPKDDQAGMQSHPAGLPLSRSEKFDLYRQILERLPEPLNTEVLFARDTRNEPLLPDAAARGDFETVKRYVKFAMRYPEAKRLSMLNVANHEGQSAIECAENGGHSTIVTLLKSRIAAARQVVEGTRVAPAHMGPQPPASQGRRRRRDEALGDGSAVIDLISDNEDEGRRVRPRLEARDRSRSGARG